METGRSSELKKYKVGIDIIRIKSVERVGAGGANGGKSQR